MTDLKKFSDIELMTLKAETEQSIQALDQNLKMINGEYLRRVNEFKKEEEAKRQPIETANA